MNKPLPVMAALERLEKGLNTALPVWKDNRYSPENDPFLDPLVIEWLHTYYPQVAERLDLGNMKGEFFRASRRVKLVSALNAAMGPPRLKLHGINVANPLRFPDTYIERLNAVLQATHRTLKARGVEMVLTKGVREVVLNLLESFNAVALYLESKTLHVHGKGMLSFSMEYWVETMVHELAHHLHLSELPPDAKRFWDSAWDEISQLEEEVTKATHERLSVSYKERLLFWEILEQAGGDLKRVKSLPPEKKAKFEWWLRQPLAGKPLLTPKQLRWSNEGENLKLLLSGGLSDLYRDRHPRHSNEQIEALVNRARNVIMQRLGVTAQFSGQYHPEGDWETVLSEAKMLTLNERAAILKKLEIPTAYGHANKEEDFADTFMLYVLEPNSLTETSRYRLLRTLSLAGLYGKPVAKFARRDYVKEC